MSIRPKAWGPISMPASRNTATSGILVFCANSPATVPTARMRPPDINVCFAISTEAGWSNCFLPIWSQRFTCKQSVAPDITLREWAVGTAVGTWMFVAANLTPNFPLAIGGYTFPGYSALYTVILNLLVTIVLTPLFNALGG